MKGILVLVPLLVLIANVSCLDPPTIDSYSVSMYSCMLSVGSLKIPAAIVTDDIYKVNEYYDSVLDYFRYDGMVFLIITA